jgi:hypothetical protein
LLLLLPLLPPWLLLSAVATAIAAVAAAVGAPLALWPFATKGTAAAANEEKAAKTATARQRRAMGASG